MHGNIHRRSFARVFASAAVAVVVASCGGGTPRQPDLPRQPDRWVDAITLDANSRVKFVGRTRDYLITEVTSMKDVEHLRRISIGDEIEGVRIGAIQCSFHWRDATYGSEQYMWRGRWACKAGRNRQEVETAVKDDGTKQFDYIHAAPVTLQRD
jgi:hypothetical protein